VQNNAGPYSVPVCGNQKNLVPEAELLVQDSGMENLDRLHGPNTVIVVVVVVVDLVYMRSLCLC